ncbi:hypothetical protein Q7P36_004267 [Cladosporium allicinum]
MNSQRGPSQILIWDSTADRFNLTNPNTDKITCIGITSSSKKRCAHPIALDHIADTESATRDLLKATLPIDETKRMEMFKRLAKATLCPHSHNHQAAGLTERWTRLFERGLPRAWCLPSGTQIYDHLGGGGSGSGVEEKPIRDQASAESRGRGANAEHQQKTGAQREQIGREASDKRCREESEEPRPRVKRRRHCELPGAACSEEEGSEKEGGSEEKIIHEQSSALQEPRGTRKACFKRRKAFLLAQEKRRTAKLRAEQKRRERDRAESDRQEEERVVRAEKEIEDGLPLDVRQQRERNAQQPWSSAWFTFGKFCNQLDSLDGRPGNIADLEIYTVDFWPSRAGSYFSCTEAAVREFFANSLEPLDRRTILKLARLWHPDRSMRLFSLSKDQKAILKKVTVVTQVLNSILETY